MEWNKHNIDNIALFIAIGFLQMIGLTNVLYISSGVADNQTIVIQKKARNTRSLRQASNKLNLQQAHNKDSSLEATGSSLEATGRSVETTGSFVEATGEKDSNYTTNEQFIHISSIKDIPLAPKKNKAPITELSRIKLFKLFILDDLPNKVERFITMIIKYKYTILGTTLLFALVILIDKAPGINVSNL